MLVPTNNLFIDFVGIILYYILILMVFSYNLKYLCH